jgi:hypothetical protein
MTISIPEPSDKLWRLVPPGLTVTEASVYAMLLLATCTCRVLKSMLRLLLMVYYQFKADSAVTVAEH